MGATPPGIAALVNARGGRNYSTAVYRTVVLVLTFGSYTLYHATRKPMSIVKGTLRDGWAPFTGEDGNSLLGSIDVAFLATYAVGMFFSGHVADTMDLRVFLTVGMLGSGLFTAVFGLCYFYDVHDVWVFYAIQVAAGVFQSTGWPAVLSVMGRWFGKSKRGLIMGIWNAHTSVGNIMGTFMASKLLRSGWGYAFTLPGIVMMLFALLVLAFLPPSPDDVGHGHSDDRGNESDKKERHRPVGFMAALHIPGVVPFALCLFFSKLVAYTFLYWLPFYIRHTPIGGKVLSAEAAGDLSVLFDIGGVAGGILAGHLSDRFNARSMVSAGFVYLAIPCLYMYREVGGLSYASNVTLLMLTGVFVNGPYALITTAVSADLGTHESLKGNASALATVTAIIDGTGSLGAAVGPMLTGYLSQVGDGWTNVFYMLYGAALCAGLLLTRLVMKEALVMMKESSTAFDLEREQRERLLHGGKGDNA